MKPPDPTALQAPPVVEAADRATTARATVAIIGVPNSGKSLLFQRLSRRFARTANYPYTTTQIEQAQTRLGERDVVLIDTPGVTGLELCSEDEAPTRELLAQQRPDVVLLCLDATNLVRSLVLAAQLADLELPVVVCLNLVDDALQRGLVVDATALSRELGVPVFPVCALDGRGAGRLARELDAARPLRPVPYPDGLGRRLDGLRPLAPRARRIDALLASAPADLLPGQSIWHTVLEAHRHWAEGIVAAVTRRTGLEPGRTAWDRVADLALHPVGSWFFLGLTLAAVYLLVAHVGVGLLAGWMDRLLVLPAVGAIRSWTGPGLLQQVLVGDFGLLSLGLFNAVCTVLPILGVFYLLFGLLEDIGYFPLLSVQFDRLLRFLGLTGKAVLPITLGFGCNTMATLTTRCLATGRQRFIACFLIALGIPCAVQLGVMLAILSTVPPTTMLGLLAVVGLLMLASGAVLARLLPRCEQGEFLVELPPLRPPRWRNIAAKTGHRLRDFLYEACPAFVASAGVLLALQLSGLLERLRQLLAPVVVQGFGLPAESTDMLLMTLARREVGAVMMKDLVDRGLLDHRQIFVGLLVMTLFVPCMSNTLVLGKVVGGRRTAVIFVAVMSIAILAGIAANALWSGA